VNFDTVFKTSPEKRAYGRKHYQKNKAYYKSVNSRWWKDHPEQRRAKDRRRRKNNPEKFKAKSKSYRERNLEKVRASRRKWQSDQWAHRQEYMRSYYERNREKIKAKSKSLYQSNKGRWWNYSQKRRVLKMQASFNLTAIREFVDSVKSKKTARCYYCGDRVITTNIHFDHIIPLAKGGQHSVDNLCVSCAPCNLSKQDKLLSRWNKHPQLFLAL